MPIRIQMKWNRKEKKCMQQNNCDMIDLCFTSLKVGLHDHTVEKKLAQEAFMRCISYAEQLSISKDQADTHGKIMQKPADFWIQLKHATKWSRDKITEHEIVYRENASDLMQFAVHWIDAFNFTMFVFFLPFCSFHFHSLWIDSLFFPNPILDSFLLCCALTCVPRNFAHGRQSNEQTN